MREAEALAQRLASAEVTVFGLLPPRQYAEVIRNSFDRSGIRGERVPPSAMPSAK